jgi:hypothetical protein
MAETERRHRRSNGHHCGNSHTGTDSCQAAADCHSDTDGDTKTDTHSHTAAGTYVAGNSAAWAAHHPAWAWVAATILGIATAYAVVMFDRFGAAQGATDWSVAVLVLLAVAVTAGATWWYSRTVLTRPFVLTAAILAVLFTAFTITGLSFNRHGDACLWSSCGAPAQIPAWAGSAPAAVVGFLVLWYAVAGGLIRLTDRLGRNLNQHRPIKRTFEQITQQQSSYNDKRDPSWRSERQAGAASGSGGAGPAIDQTMPSGHPTPSALSRASSRLGNLAAAHPFAVAAAMITICWLPYLVILFPGTYAFDGFRQLNEFYGYLPRTTHHPYLATAAMGGLFSIGKVISVNGALFLYTLVQATAGCLVFALTCTQVWRLAAAVIKGRRRRWVMTAYGLTLAFFALNPAFPIGATVIFKDFPYTLSVLVLVNVLVAAAIQGQMNNKVLATFVAGSVGAAGFRNDGIVIVVICAVCLVLLLTERRLRVMVAAGLVAGGLVIANTVVFPAIGVTKYSNAEMMSVPLQQTARYLKVHPQDVTADERQTLQSLLRDGKRVEDLGKAYRPNLSDPVKNRFESFSGTAIKRYLGVWWAMALRHPATYVEATAANTIGYFFPAPKTNTPPIQYPSNMHLEDEYWEKMKAELSQPGADFDPDYPAALAPVRAGVIEAAKWTVRAPVLGLIYNPALYTWILLISAALVIRRKPWRAWLPYVPAVLVFLVCLASPVNGNLRYAMPYVATVPLLVAYGLYALSRPGRAAGFEESGNRLATNRLSHH